MQRHILIIEGDPDIAEGLRNSLGRENLRACVTHTVEDGLAAALDPQDTPSLIILDLLLPVAAGLELCRRLRREPRTRRTPIIVLTARTSDTDIAAGLDLGADDYVTKPFSIRELMARVRAMLRRIDESEDESYNDGRLLVDFSCVRVACCGEPVRLTRKEFELLTLLVQRPGRVVTRRQILDRVWSPNYYNDTRTLDVHIRRLRQKLGPCGDRIETVIRVGYRFAQPTSCAGLPAASANASDGSTRPDPRQLK